MWRLIYIYGGGDYYLIYVLLRQYSRVGFGAKCKELWQNGLSSLFGRADYAE